MMQAGKYYVGDLCYVMTDEEWDEVCGLTIINNDCAEGEFTLSDGRRFAMYGTKWGDGEYRSNVGTKHSVDSGTIGCILVNDIKAQKYLDIETLGAMLDFDENFTTFNKDGLIVFGMVIINTDPDEYYDDEEDLEYDDY
jgi:hypothetical protein